MNELIFWNDNNYSKNLENLFGRESIIVSQPEYENLQGDFSKYDCVVLLCELKWSYDGSGLNMQHLFGIELAKELRRLHNLELPILFVSFFPLTNIFNTDREILTSIGHSFFQLPGKPQDFKAIINNSFFNDDPKWKLSKMEISDIKSFYCSKEGILSHELHYLNRYLNFEITIANHYTIYSELLETIRKIHELFLLDFLPADTLFKVLFPELTKSNISEAVNHIIRIGNTLQNKYGNKPTAKPSVTDTTNPNMWKVLFLDDEIDDHHELIRCIKENGIDILCVHSAERAMEILKEDAIGQRKIMVVVADYRLYEKDSSPKKHQKIQGYKFLKDVAASDYPVRLVAFSGLSRKFLLNSFRHYNLRTEVKSKIDYLSDDHTHQIFCDELTELAEENWEMIEALPSKCSGFKNSLELPYKVLRMNPSYDRIERDISLTSKEYVRIIQEQIRNKTQISIGTIDNIKSPMAKPKVNKEQIVAGAGTPIYDDAYFNRFQNYMIARRIALWLYASNKKGNGIGVESREISRRIVEILTNKKYPTDAYRQVTSTNLGLSLDDFPFNITIEERYWLHYEMEIPIIRDIDCMLPAFSQCSIFLRNFISKVDFLKKMIEEKSFCLEFIYKGDRENKNNKTEVLFNKDFSPVIKVPGDLKEVYWLLKNIASTDETLSIQLDKIVTYIRHTLQQSLESNTSTYTYSLLQYFNSIVVKYSISKNKEAKVTNSDNEFMYQLFTTGQKLDEKKFPHLLHLYSSAFMAFADLLAEGLTLDETTKKRFFERITFYEGLLDL